MAQTTPLDGTWEITMAGRSGGTAYFTFDHGLVDGYGITRDFFLPFTLATGTNNAAPLSAIVCGTTAGLSGSTSNNTCEVLRIEEFNNIFNVEAIPVTLTGETHSEQSLKGVLTTPRGPISFKGTRPASIADIAGAWSGDVKMSTLWPVASPDGAGCPVTPLTGFKKSAVSQETWTITPTPGRPGSFDIAGEGLVLSNSFIVTGTIIVGSHNKLIGFMQADFGSIGVVLYNFTGKMNLTKGTLKVTGYDTHHGVLGKISGVLTR